MHFNWPDILLALCADKKGERIFLIEKLFPTYFLFRMCYANNSQPQRCHACFVYDYDIMTGKINLLWVMFVIIWTLKTLKLIWNVCLEFHSSTDGSTLQKHWTTVCLDETRRTVMIWAHSDPAVAFSVKAGSWLLFFMLIGLKVTPERCCAAALISGEAVLQLQRS